MPQITIAQLQMTMTNIAAVASLVSFWAFVLGGASKWKAKIYKFAEILIIIGFICLSLSIVLRGFEANRFPLANLYESTLWFSWAILGGYIALARRLEQNQLGWLASLTATMFFLYGSWLPGNQQTITPLVPALVSYWRQIHVPPVIISYALFCLSGLASLLELWYAGRLRSLIIASITIIAAISAICLGTYTSIDTAWLQLLFVGSSIVGIFIAWKNLGKIAVNKVNGEKAAIYDEMSWKAISIALPLLTFGVITGGLWANHAWGTYWSWDPKESMALVTWLSYAA